MTMRAFSFSSVDKVAVVVPVQASQNFLVSLVAMAVGESLYVHPFARSVAQVFDHLHCTVRAGIVFDEATDKSDDQGGRFRPSLNGNDGSRGAASPNARTNDRKKKRTSRTRVRMKRMTGI